MHLFRRMIRTLRAQDRRMGGVVGHSLPRSVVITIAVLAVAFGAAALLSGNAGADTPGSISGRVVDAMTGQPIAGASVWIVDGKTGATANEEGRYDIAAPPEGTHELAAGMIGYERAMVSVTVRTGENMVVDFELIQDAVVMEEVTVSAKVDRETQEIQEIRNSPVAVTVIDGRDFRGRDVSLNDIISRVAGVKVRSEGGLGSADRIAIHGMEGKRVKIFIDGSPVEAPDGSFGLNDIPIQLIERIEIYKGVVPAHFGGDCLGGAVNVVIREFETDYIDLNYTRGSYNTHRGTWVFTKVFDGPGIQIGTGGMYNYSDNDYDMESPYQPGLVITRDHNRYISHAGGLTVKLNKAWFDEIELALEWYGNDKEIQGIQTNIQHAKTKSMIWIPGLTLEKDGFFLENLSFDYDVVVPFMKANFIDTSYWRYTFDGQKYRSPNGRGEVGWDPHDSDDHQREIRQRLNLKYRFNDMHSINWNTVAKYSKREPDDPMASGHAGYNIGDYPSETSKAVSGLTHELTLFGGRTVNSASIKYFYIGSKIAATGLHQQSLHGTPKTVDSSFSKFGFSEALRHRVYVPLIVKASYEHTMRLPNPGEVFGDGVQITPAPNLAPEVSDNGNVGAVFDTIDILGMPSLFAEIEGFYRYTSDMINLEGNGVNLGYVNLGEIETKGIEMEIRADVHDYVYLYTNATYQDLRDVRNHVAGTKTPNPTKNMRVPHIPWYFANYGFDLHKENLFGDGQFGKLFWEGAYVREYYYAWDVTSREKRTIPSTFEQTVGIEYSFMNGGLSLSFEVQNLTDADLFDIYNFPRPGRNYHAAIRYSWFREHSAEQRYRTF